MHPFISVIVPFYNEENGIGRMIETIRRQTFTDFEVILVDDDSTDASVIKAKKYIDSDDRFKIISHSTRRGSSSGFNTGLANATGVYVVKCDADDSLDSDYLQNLATAAREGDYDIVITNLALWSSGKVKYLKPKSDIRSLNDFIINTAYMSLCNKILRRSMLVDNQIEAYDGVDRWDDLAVVARFMALRPRLKVLDVAGYNYAYERYVGSLSKSRNRELLEDHLQCAANVIEWFSERGLLEEFEEFLNHMKFFAKVKYIRKDSNDIDSWRNTYPEVNERIMSLRHLPMVYRIGFAVINALPRPLALMAVRMIR